jgi:uncharacterized protein (TIGR02391 family)
MERFSDVRASDLLGGFMGCRQIERSEHKGFALLLKGAFAAVRNPTAHEPKILWQGEDDAADYFTLLSMLHRKLDKARAVGAVRRDLT